MTWESQNEGSLNKTVFVSFGEDREVDTEKLQDALFLDGMQDVGEVVDLGDNLYSVKVQVKTMERQDDRGPWSYGPPCGEIIPCCKDRAIRKALQGIGAISVSIDETDQVF